MIKTVVIVAISFLSLSGCQEGNTNVNDTLDGSVQMDGSNSLLDASNNMNCESRDFTYSYVAGQTEEYKGFQFVMGSDVNSIRLPPNTVNPNLLVKELEFITNPTYTNNSYFYSGVAGTKLCSSVDCINPGKFQLNVRYYGELNPLLSYTFANAKTTSNYIGTTLSDANNALKIRLLICQQ